MSHFYNVKVACEDCETPLVILKWPSTLTENFTSSVSARNAAKLRIPSWIHSTSFFVVENRTTKEVAMKHRKRHPSLGYNWHHVPPKHPASETPKVIWAKKDGQKLLYIKKSYHDAYHLLFANAANLEQCIEILKANWWLL